MTNLDILIMNQNAAMYSEKEYDWAFQAEKEMFDELKEDDTEG